MRRLAILSALFCLTALPSALAQNKLQDLKKAVPSDVFLVVHGKHNPERDYQQAHYAKVWETFQETKLVEKVLRIVTESAPEEELAQVTSVFDELYEAAKPIDLAALSGDKVEVVYAQRMNGLENQQLGIIRLGDEAENWEQAFSNLMKLAEKYSQGDVPVQVYDHRGATVTTLSLPPQVPFAPVVARLDDVLFVANSTKLLEQSIDQLLDPNATSKFDDPRFKEALSNLPEPEDSLAFYDGRVHFEQMKSMGDTIREMAGGNADAERVVGLMNVMFDELSILDYECSVEYTDGNQNLSQAFGKLMPNSQDKMLFKAFASNKPIENWESWVPADAVSYSVQSGVNMHAIYAGMMDLIQEHFPEAQEGLDQFSAMQEQLDIDIDADILQSFPGEIVSITLPPAVPSMMGSQDSVMAMRCTNPEKIKELLHRGFDALAKQPAVQFQQFRIIESQQLEGFEELSAIMLSALGARPTFGFQDGWMWFGSNAQAIQRVLDVKAGTAESIVETDKFKQLAPEFSGPVSSISYSNLGENIRSAAKALGQGSAMAQMAIGFSGMPADAEELKPIKQILSLLPDVAKVVASFDFLEEQISVTQSFDSSGAAAYVRKSVISVRPVEPESETEVESTTDNGQ